MTARKHFKGLVRERMKKTGERYASARRHVLAQPSDRQFHPAARWHFAGSIPATTALRVLLAQAGVRSRITGQPYSEEMLFGIAGGIGCGMASFYYEKGDVATFFVAGRHDWQDDEQYLKDALARFGIEAQVQETSGAKAAQSQLREALANGPCIAWVDMAHLPHRALPSIWSGGGYHVITVYAIDDSSQTAWIGDRTDEPVQISLADLAVARARIKKQKHRLLSIHESSAAPDLESLVRSGLAACHAGMIGRPKKGYPNMFNLDGFRLWGERMHGSTDPERWERVFGTTRLWRGLVSIHEFIENYHTGGGLCRPLFADFLTEAAAALKDQRLRAVGARYAELGRSWSELADAALPDDVPLLKETKELHDRKAELSVSGNPDDLDEGRAAWARLDELERQAKEKFPLSEPACADLRAGLQRRILAIHKAEVAAHAALAAVLQIPSDVDMVGLRSLISNQVHDRTLAWPTLRTFYSAPTGLNSKAQGKRRSRAALGLRSRPKSF